MQLMETTDQLCFTKIQLRRVFLRNELHSLLRSRVDHAMNEDDYASRCLMSSQDQDGHHTLYRRQTL